ncbi:NAD(P)/FAD-dependent oxidoreductase [Halolamina salifodinae]|uniref:Phytoene dehydrogenase-like protein n=1 Tax=Halolamina salifodinae TaxID=1202767 RepID=A0A8T4H021_9EURY|nr:NAD(P)/FAD-dependent oxidoreductase [Halolamina salifodinae]MBP1986945.1 phytoene dehydrogenase-like protein [Halolamina salifodinae]
MDTTVVGGGLAGLVAARRLAEAGHDVTLFEERAELGGRVRSRTVEGFTCDRGFQVLFDAYPAVQRELDLDALSLRSFAPGGVICRPRERSTLSDPLRDPSALLPSALSPEVTLADKLRTLRPRFRLTRGDWPDFDTPDRSIREYLREAGFSEKFVENFAAPLYGGITLDRSISTSANVFEYTFRAMSLGSIVVPAEGMAAIPAQLAERARSAGVDVRTGVAVEDLDVEGQRVRLATEAGDRAFDAAVVATDPPTARELTGVESIPTEGAGVVTQHYRLPGPELDAGTRIMLNAGSEAPNTVAQLSAVAPEYGDGSNDVLLAASFVDDGAQDRPAEKLAAQTREALASWYPERNVSGLEVLATDRIPFAQFAQPPGSHARLPDADDPTGPVVLAGDYTRWSSIQGALESGRRAATALTAAFDG